MIILAAWKERRQKQGGQADSNPRMHVSPQLNSRLAPFTSQSASQHLVLLHGCFITKNKFARLHKPSPLNPMSIFKLHPALSHTLNLTWNRPLTPLFHIPSPLPISPRSRSQRLRFLLNMGFCRLCPCVSHLHTSQSLGAPTACSPSLVPVPIG